MSKKQEILTPRQAHIEALEAWSAKTAAEAVRERFERRLVSLVEAKLEQALDVIAG